MGGSGDSLALYLVKCLEICLFEITIFEVHASAVKAQVRHLNYKKEKKNCQCLHYKVLSTSTVLLLSNLLRVLETPSMWSWAKLKGSF